MQNARLKYTIDRMGLDNFMAEVEKRMGWSLQPARPFVFDRNVDDFGWTTGEDGKHHFTLFIENGRVQDEADRSFKTGLREIAKVHKGTFRMTANQHMVVADVASEDLSEIKRLLSKYKLDNLTHTGLRLSSSACVAFPTCGDYSSLLLETRVLNTVYQVWRWQSQNVYVHTHVLAGDKRATNATDLSIFRSSLTKWRRYAKKTDCGTTPLSCA